MAGIGTELSAAAFDVLYLASRDRLTVQVAALTGDAAEAADHVQEAFVRAWARWDRVAELEDPEGWVRRVAHNLAVSRWRRARRTVLRATAPEITVEWDDDQIEIVAALRGLPRVQREAIVLHHLVGMPVARIAADLHVPVGTVKSWLARGRRALGEALGDQVDTGDPTRSTEEVPS